MIKVVTRGVPKGERPITATCGGCDSVIEFQPSDASRYSSVRNEDFFQLKCPVCNSVITKEVP